MNFDSTALENMPEETGSSPRMSDSYSQGRKIKNTTSICPHCLEAVAAEVFERHGEVWMDKSCARHGDFSALLSSDIKHYLEPSARQTQGTSCCGSSCGLPATEISNGSESAPWTNHSCTILIEITERCNLSCPTCFAGSSPQHSKMMSLEEFTRQVDQLVAGGKSGSDMIQLSGGEPTVHPRFFDMVDLLFERGFGQVCINSNGIKLAQPAFTERLANCMSRRDGEQIFVYLQFDGFEDSTHIALRGRRDLLDIKRRALDNCRAQGINVHPVMTLTRGINDHEVGDFVQLAVENPALKNVVIQPAMYSGRYDNPRRQDRITLADTVDLICDQFNVFTPQDFVPIPCSDPNCFRMAVAFRTGSGLLPVSRYFPRYESWDSDESRGLIDAFTDTINGPQAISEAIRWITSDGQIENVLQDLDDAGVDRLLDLIVEAQSGDGSLWDSLLTISIKPFMDAWTYDQDRIEQCCVHILDQDGNPVSFCEFNAINRPRMMDDSLPGIRVINA
ncbi:MAG: radical SAM protein [Xanthomonadales bacterium]